MVGGVGSVGTTSASVGRTILSHTLSARESTGRRVTRSDDRRERTRLWLVLGGCLPRLEAAGSDPLEGFERPDRSVRTPKAGGSPK
jgi:hypothetical protein